MAKQDELFRYSILRPIPEYDAIELTVGDTSELLAVTGVAGWALERVEHASALEAATSAWFLGEFSTASLSDVAAALDVTIQAGSSDPLSFIVDDGANKFSSDSILAAFRTLSAADRLAQVKDGVSELIRIALEPENRQVSGSDVAVLGRVIRACFALEASGSGDVAKFVERLTMPISYVPDGPRPGAERTQAGIEIIEETALRLREISKTGNYEELATLPLPIRDEGSAVDRAERLERAALRLAARAMIGNDEMAGAPAVPVAAGSRVSILPTAVGPLAITPQPDAGLPMMDAGSATLDRIIDDQQLYFDVDYNASSILVDLLWEKIKRERVPSGLRPIGKQDLLVVRDRLIGYRPSEIRHVENVAQGETRSRTHESVSESETVRFDESATEEETLDDLTTTARDEIREEVQTEVKRELELAGKVRVSYRGFVAVDAEASARSLRAEGRSSRVAAEHAVETVERAVTRVRERVTRRVENRVRRLVSEVNLHSFTNKSTEPVSAIYYWLEKVYRAAVYNYGERTMYEVVLRDPAKQLLSVLGTADPLLVPATPPPAGHQELLDSIVADAVSEDRLPLQGLEEAWEKGVIARDYNLADSPARPSATTVSASASTSRTGDAASGYVTETIDIEIPEGFEGVSFEVSVQTHADTTDVAPAATVSLVGYTLLINQDTLSGWGSFGNARNDSDDDLPVSLVETWKDSVIAEINDTPNSLQLQALAGLTGRVSRSVAWGTITRRFPRDDTDGFAPLRAGKHVVGVTADDVNVLSVTIEVDCQPTAETLVNWRQDLLARVVAAYELQRERYLQAALGGAAADPSPLEDLSDRQAAELREIERDELKRAVIAKFLGIPEGENFQVTAEEIVFCEQAFEWEYIDAEHLGYFWSDKSSWGSKLRGLQAGDRPWREFIAAGATRVLVPVRPGFQQAVAHFLRTFEIWPDAGQGGIGDPSIVSQAEGQRPSSGPLAEKLQLDEATGDPISWTYAVPTDLVMLSDEVSWGRLQKNIPKSKADPLVAWSQGTGPVTDTDLGFSDGA